MSNLQPMGSHAEPEEDATTEAIDVSANNLAVNWHQVTAPIAIVKLTEGVGFVDKRAAALCAGAKSAGKTLGAYHYLRLRAGKPQDGAQQARDFAAEYVKHGCEFAFVDVERAENEKATPSEAHETVRQFGAEWKAILNDPLGIYTSKGEAQSFQLEAVPELASLPLWMAAYSLIMPAPPKPWTSVLLWQRSGSAQCPGVDGQCDRSTFAGTLAQFRAALGLTE